MPAKIRLAPSMILHPQTVLFTSSYGTQLAGLLASRLSPSRRRHAPAPASLAGWVGSAYSVSSRRPSKRPRARSRTRTSSTSSEDTSEIRSLSGVLCMSPGPKPRFAFILILPFHSAPSFDEHRCFLCDVINQETRSISGSAILRTAPMQRGPRSCLSSA
jgi:hypothetical protein